MRNWYTNGEAKDSLVINGKEISCVLDDKDMKEIILLLNKSTIMNNFSNESSAEKHITIHKDCSKLSIFKIILLVTCNSHFVYKRNGFEHKVVCSKSKFPTIKDSRSFFRVPIDLVNKIIKETKKYTTISLI